jgi:hypothetical protein
VTERDVQESVSMHRKGRAVQFENGHSVTVLICRRCRELWPCTVFNLAAEVERLRRLHEARPPYHLASYSPAELDELLARDTAIWKAREDVT